MQCSDFVHGSRVPSPDDFVEVMLSTARMVSYPPHPDRGLQSGEDAAGKNLLLLACCAYLCHPHRQPQGDRRLDGVRTELCACFCVVLLDDDNLLFDQRAYTLFATFSLPCKWASWRENAQLAWRQPFDIVIMCVCVCVRVCVCVCVCVSILLLRSFIVLSAHLVCIP
jgi:hypothetical protein